MKITKRSVSMSALALMSSLMIVPLGADSEAAQTATADLTLTTNVSGIMALQLEYDAAADYDEIISLGTYPTGVTPTGMGTLDFGTIDFGGNIYGDANYYLFTDPTNSTPLSMATVGYTSYWIDDNDELYPHATTGLQTGSNTAGALYVVGSNPSYGAVRHRVIITGSPTANAQLVLHNETGGTDPWTAPDDDFLPLYVAKDTVAWDDIADDEPKKEMPTTAATSSANNGLNGVVRVGTGSGNAFDVGEFLEVDNSASGITTETNYMNNQTGALDYAVRVAVNESVDLKETVARYTLVPSPGTVSIVVNFN